MFRFRPSIPIGLKIFGVATSMLSLLLGVSYANHYRIGQVTKELVDIAKYITPIGEKVTTINVRVLRQEIHFERILRYYEEDSVERDSIDRELKKFEELGTLVDVKLAEAVSLSEDAIKDARKIEDAVEFARLQPLLLLLEEEHQKLHDRSLEVVQLLEAQRLQEAELLAEKLEEDDNDYDRRVRQIVLQLQEFTEASTWKAEERERSTLELNRRATTVAIAVGILFSSGVTLSLIRPVRKLVGGIEEVEHGNLEARVAVKAKDEIGTLADSFNRMMDEVRQKERLKATFGQYLDPRIVDTLIHQPGGFNTSQKQVMTVFFSDMAGFSTISEMLTPEGLVNLINEYLTLASEPIVQHNGAIDQFIGDAVKAFWGQPFVSEADCAKLACYAALDQLSQLEKLRRKLPEIVGFRKGLPRIDVRIGLATGELVVGNIGSEKSKSYTVMGKAVQVAEQLEGASKRYGTTILMTEATKVLAEDSIETREIDIVQLTEKDEPVRIYELLGCRDAIDPKIAQLRDRFEAGLQAYRQENWSLARSHFEACLSLKATDGPTRVYLQRLEQRLIS